MRKITIMNTDLELSPMGMGCVNAGIKWDGEDAFRIFDAFLDMGGTVYDTAVYILTGSHLRSDAANVSLVSGSARVESVTISSFSPRAVIRI